MSRSDFSMISDAMESYFAKGQLERKRIKYKSRLFCDTIFLWKTYGRYLGQGLNNVEKPVKATETALSSYEHRNVKKSQNEITALLIQ